ncbi:MAG: hypothetical protein RLZZ245_3756 [Verrucomicrobiota bacterium]
MTRKPNSPLIQAPLRARKSRNRQALIDCRKLTALLVTLSSGSLVGADLLRWDITGTTGTSGGSAPSAPAPGVSGSAMTGGGGSGNSTSPSGTWNRNFTAQSDFDSALTAGNYYAFTTSANEGYTVSISGLTGLNLSRTSTGPGSAGLFYSTDGVNFIQTGSTFTVGTTLASASTNFSQSLASSPLEISSGSTVYWRIVVFGGGSRLGIGKADTVDVTFTGTSTADVAARNLLWTGNGGEDWNTDPSNTNWADSDAANTPTYFNTADNVTINSPASISVDLAGLSAGLVSINSSAGDITLANGPLTALAITKNGTGTLTLSGSNSFSGGSILNAGTVVMDGNLALGTTPIALNAVSLEATSNTNSVSNSITLGSAGGVLDNSADVNFSGNITGTGSGTSLTKTGSGQITFSASLGTMNTGPVDFDLLAGSAVFSGTGSTRQKNLSGTNTFNGPLTLAGPVLSLHGSTVSGTGAITVTNASSTISSRLNYGTVDVNLPITLNTNLILDSPNGNNLLRLNSPISGTGGLIKSGNGTAGLSATNDYTGLTTVNAGTLRIGSGTNGTLGSADVVVSAASIQFNRTDSVTIPNQISGTGNVILSSPDGTTSLTAENTYTGKTTLNGGRLGAPVISDGGTASSIGQSSSEAVNLLFNGGSLLYQGTADTFTDRDFSLGTSGGGPSVGSSGDLTFTSTNPITLSAPALSVLSRTVDSTAIAAGTVYQIVTLGDTDFTSIGAASNTVGTEFTATGPGTGTGTATYGALVIGETYRIWTSSADFTSLGASSNDVGTVFVATGTGIGLQASAGVVAYRHVRSLSLGGSGTGKGSLAAAIIDGTPEEIDAGGPLLNASGLTKNGSSTWAISGTNTYSGPTTINSGTLLIDGDNSAANGPVTVMNGSFLGGSGTSGAAVAFSNGAGVASKITNWTAQAGTGNTQLTIASASIDGSLAVSLDTSELINFTEEARSFTLLKAGSVTGDLSPSTTVTAPGFPGTGSWTLNRTGGDLILNYNLASADPYAAWATANQLSGSSALANADPDQDGISNLVEFVIGGNPNANQEADKLPSATLNGDNLVFSFFRTQDAAYLNPTVQYGSDLTAWTTAANGSNGVSINVTANVSPGTDQVLVTIPRSLASGAKLFARLNVTNTADQ